jgi:hypothetical protein
LPPAEEGDSLGGLAGYHGSVVTANDERVYFTVSVYSERGARGTTNGIPVFAAAWKNVVATLYHQLAETRTDPDVEEAMRHAADGRGERYLGWVSDSGLEVGDYSVRADIPLTSVFREVSLASGGGSSTRSTALFQRRSRSRGTDLAAAFPAIRRYRGCRRLRRNAVGPLQSCIRANDET